MFTGRVRPFCKDTAFDSGLQRCLPREHEGNNCWYLPGFLNVFQLAVKGGKTEFYTGNIPSDISGHRFPCANFQSNQEHFPCRTMFLTTLYNLAGFKPGNCRLVCWNKLQHTYCYSAKRLMPAFSYRCGHKSPVVLSRGRSAFLSPQSPICSRLSPHSKENSHFTIF